MMKIYQLATATALTLAASLALAQQEPLKPSPPPPPPGQPAPAQAQDDNAAPLLPAPMQQRLEEMQTFMERMNQTTDPAERQKLVQEHRQKMQELTGMIRNLHGGPMGGMHGMMGGGQGPMGGGPGMMGGDHDKAGGMSCMMGESHHNHEMMMGLMAAYRQMDKRLDLMQHLLEKMLEEKQD